MHHFNEDGASGGAKAVGEKNDVFRSIKLGRCGGDGCAVDIDTEGFVVEERVGYVFALDSGEKITIEGVGAEELGPGGEILVCFDINATGGDEIAGG